MAEWETISKKSDGWETVSADGWETVGKPTKPQETTLGEDWKIGMGGVANTLTKATGLGAGGIASLVGATDTADSIYKFMEDTVKKTEQEVNPENKQQSFGGKVASALTTLPAQLVAFPFSPADTGQSMLQNGDSLESAQSGALLDTLGNVVGTSPLMNAFGSNVLKRVGSSAAINAAQDYATRLGISSVAESDKSKEQFAPSWETAGVAAITGAPFGLLGGSKQTAQPKPEATPKNLPRNVDAELIKRAQKNSEHQLDALILLRKQYEDAIEAGDNSPETIAAHQEVTSQIQHVTRILETAIAEQSGNTHPTRVAQGEDINAIKEARNKAFVEKQNLIDPNDPWKGVPEIPVKKGQLGPDEVAPIHDTVPDMPPRSVGEFDPETGQMVKEGTPPVDPTPDVPKQTPMQVAQDRVRQVMEDGTKLNDFKEQAQAMLDDLPNRVPRDDTPGSHYSALKEALEAELNYYNKKTEPVVEAKSDVPDIVEPKGMGIDVFKNIQDLFKQLQSTDVGLDKLRYYQQWAKDGMQRMAGFGEGQHGYDPTHDYTITWENLKKTHDFLAEKIAQKEAEAYNEPVQTEPSGPKTYDTMEALVRDTVSEDPVVIANQRRVAMEQNPQLFTTPKGTTVKFSTEIPKMLRDIITHFMKITKMDQDGIFVVFDPTLTARGRIMHSDNKGVMYLNPVGIKEHGNWMSKQPVLKEMFAAGRMKDVLDNVMMSRFAAHEMGHFLLNKYLTSAVTHIDDLTHIQKRWETYLANNKLHAISVFDINDPVHRANYQKAFHEFFSEQLAKELLHKQLVDKFTFGKGQEAGKYLNNLKRVVYHSAKYVEGLVGKHIDKDNFAKDIIQDILTGNKDFIKNISKQSAERLEMMKYNDQVIGAIKADKNAFPFVDDGTDRFVVRTASGIIVNPGTYEHTRYFLKNFEGMYKEQQAGADTGAKYPSELDIPNYDAVPLSMRTVVGMGVGFTKNFFAKQTLRKIFQSDPLVRTVNDIIRKGEQRAAEAHSWMLYETPSFEKWKASGFMARMSKAKSEASVFFHLQKASNVDTGAVHDVFMKGFDEGLPYADNLTQNGGNLTPKQVKLYDTLSKLFKKQFDIIKNAEKDLEKKDKLQYREGWYPAVRNGKYSVTLRYLGNAVHVETFRSKVEANLFLDSIKKGGSTKIQADPIVEKGADANLGQFTDGITKAQDIIANMFPNAGGAVRETIQQTLINMRGGGVGVHTKFRSGMKGYRGSELFGDLGERGNSFKRAVQDSMNEYAAGVKSMYVMNDLKDVLHSDEAKQRNNPESQMISEQMVTSALNRIDSKVFSSMDSFVRETWDRAMSARKGYLNQDGSDSFDSYYNRTLELFYMTKLLGKPLFALNQVLTSLQAIRELSYEAGFLGPYVAMSNGIGKLMGGNKDLQHALYLVSTQYHTFEPQFMEALHLNEDGSNPSGVVWNNIKKYVFLNKLSEVGDSLSRVISFASAFSMYRDAGHEFTQAMYKAMEVADQAMGLTGRSETPAMFSKMGLVGQGVKPLQMFGQNALGNLVADIKHAKIKNPSTWAPLVNNTLIMLVTGGVTGSIFAAEYEILRLWLEKHAPDWAPPSLLEMFKVQPDLVKDLDVDPVMVNKALQYGLGSLTGVDALSSMRANETFLTLAGSVITGQEEWYKMFPAVNFGVDLAKGANTFGQLALSKTGVINPPSNAAVRQAASSALPSGPISYAAKDMLGVNEAQVAGQGTGMMAAGKENQGVTPLTTTDRVAGYLGTRGADEKYVSAVTRLSQEKEMLRKEQVKSLYVRAMETKPFAADGKTPTNEFKAIIQKLVDKQETPDQIVSNLQGEAYKRATSLVMRSVINKQGEFSETPETLRKASLLKNFGLLKEK